MKTLNKYLMRPLGILILMLGLHPYASMAEVTMVVEHWPPWEIANDPERQKEPLSLLKKLSAVTEIHSF